MRRLAAMPFIVRFALCLAIIFIPLVAFAQDVVDAPAPAPVITQPDVAALTPMVLDFIGHAKQGRIALAVVAGLILLSQLVLRFGRRLPGDVGKALASPLALWLVPQALSILGAMGTMLATGAAFNVDLLIGAVLLGLAGGGIGAKAAQTATAEAVGADAAAKTDTKAEAVAALEKGPPAP